MLISLVFALSSFLHPSNLVLLHIASSETVKFFLLTDKRSLSKGGKKRAEEEGISGRVAELNIYQEIRVWANLG